MADPETFALLTLPDHNREGEYERLLALHAEGRMGYEIPLGDVTIDPDESTSP